MYISWVYWRLCVLCHSSGLSATHYSCLKGGHQAKLHTRSVLPGLSHVCVGPPWTDSHLLPGATLFTHDKHQNNDGLKFSEGKSPSLGNLLQVHWWLLMEKLSY